MRQEKQLLLDEVKGQIDQYKSFVIMKYLKFGSNSANAFRGEVAKRGGGVEIVRKRILVKAAQAAGIDLTRDALEGHVGLVYGGNDPLETAKFVFEFGRTNNDAIQVIGGHIDGKLYSAADVDMLSKLPSMNELRAQFLGTLEAPMAQTLAVFEALLTSVPHCLQNKSEAEGQ